LQPAIANGWISYAGTVDKPTDIDLSVTLSRSASTAVNNARR
jgi:hypothetical protein